MYFMVKDRDVHNFTLTRNWTRVKSLVGGTKQLVLRRNNWAIRPISTIAPIMLTIWFWACIFCVFRAHWKYTLKYYDRIQKLNLTYLKSYHYCQQIYISSPYICLYCTARNVRRTIVFTTYNKNLEVPCPPPLNTPMEG